MNRKRPRPSPTPTVADDAFDTSIDWDEAVKELDQLSSQNQPSLSTHNSTAFRKENQPQTTVPAKAGERLAPTSFLPPRHPPVHSSRVQLEPSHQRTTAQALRPPQWMDSKRTSRPSSAGSTQSQTSKKQARSSPQRTLPTCHANQQSLPSSLQFDPSVVQAVNDGHRKDLVQHAELTATLNNGWTLFSHQKRAILRGLIMRRMILALDMGTGKTLVGCVWAKAFRKTFDDLKVLVLCPVSLKTEWKRTAIEATGLSVQSDGDKGINEDGDVFISSWSKVPTEVPTEGPFVVIADEAHAIQSMNSARTKDFMKLVLQGKNQKRCLGVLLLTGTPMKNGKPSNLFPLLKAVRHPFGAHQKAYEEHFCAAQNRHVGGGRTVWQATGSSNLSQLRELTHSHILYLTKDEVLKELPKHSREFVHAPVSSRRELQHTKALQDLAKVYNSNGGAPRDDHAVLGAVQKLRMVGSYAKIDATVQLAKKILETEAAVVIFTTFAEVCKQVYNSLAEAGWTGECMTGETPAKKRQSMVDRFQDGMSAVFCCTFGVGGVGLTLTAAQTVILLDRPWTPGDAQQAEDRVRRIGQTKPVRSIWISSFELDKQIDRMLAAKQQTSTTVLDRNTKGDGENPENNEGTKLSIFQMLKGILPNSVGARTKDDRGMIQTDILRFTQSPSQKS